MAIQVSCPKCAGRLKMSKPPAKGTRVKCPLCGQQFLPPAVGIAAGPPPNGAAQRQPIVAPGLRGAPKQVISAGLGIGLIAAVLLVGAGIVAAILLSGSRPAPEKKDAVASSKKTGETEPPPPKNDLTKREVPAEKPEPIKKEEPSKPIVEKKEEPVKPKSGEDDAERQKQFVSHMIAAGVAEEGKRLEDAASAYTAALKVMPDNAEAKQKLQQIQAVLAAQMNQKKETNKLQEEVGQLVAQAEKSMQAKQFAAAAEFYKLALQKSPADAAAGQGLIAAQDALTKDAAEQKKLTDFQNHIIAGKAAMQTGRNADAIREFLAAQQLLPTNFEAATLHRQAEQQLAAAQNQEDRKKQYQALVDQAGVAMRGGRLADAELAYRQALQLVPNDPLATQGLADTQRAAQVAQAEFQNQMTRGNQAMAAGRMQDAILAFREAVRVSPGNDVATRALRDAESAYDRTVTYGQAIRLARSSMFNKRYGDAVAAYTQALQAAPNDPVASQGLLDARQKLEVETRNLAQFEQLVQNGMFSVKVLKYSDAANAFSQALKLVPYHPQAQLVQQQATYCDAMAKGNAAMSGNRYPEAVQFYQLAVQAMPGDFNAMSALTRAKTLKR